MPPPLHSRYVVAVSELDEVLGTAGGGADAAVGHVYVLSLTRHSADSGECPRTGTFRMLEAT